MVNFPKELAYEVYTKYHSGDELSYDDYFPRFKEHFMLNMTTRAIAESFIHILKK
jgi:hypothetical protein